MIRKHQKFLNIIQVVLDALSILFAHIVAVLFKLKYDASYIVGESYYINPFWMVPLLLVIYYFMGVYTPMRSRLFRKEVLTVARAHIVGVIVILSILFLNKQIGYSREVSLVFAMLGFFSILLERYAVRRTLHYVRKKGFNQKYMLIVGAGQLGVEFSDKVFAQQDYGYNIVGFLDDGKDKINNNIAHSKIIGDYTMLKAILEQQIVDEVVVALPLSAYKIYGSIINECEKSGVRVRIIPDYSKVLSGHPQIEDFDGIPLLNVRNIPLDDPLNNFLKRLFDIVVSVIAIILAAPLMFIVAIGIKLSSPGPILFRQERVGLNNHPFTMLKFRSMRVESDIAASTTWTTVHDPRKTKFGSFIRKTSIDELPQFFNVLFGSMSVVGPRPERPYFVQQFKEQVPKYMVKHQVKPGITGWAQVSGWRGDTSIDKRIECDIYYIENWDLLLDIKIVIMTIIKGLVNKNAY